MRKFSGAVVALTLALVVSACSAGGSEGSGDGASDGSDAQVADITDRALALEDLPTGWAEDNSDDDDDDDDDPLECLEEAEGSFDDGLIGEAEVAYVDGATAPQLNQNLAQFASASAASDAMAILDGVFDGCGSFTYEQDGQEITGQIGKVSLPDVTGADDQANYQMTMEAEGFTFSAGILLLAKDEYLTMLILLDLGSFDADQLVEFGSIAVDKLAT